jgi:hypothetical protein
MKTRTCLLSAVTLAATSAASLALSITPDTGILNSTRWEGPETSQSQINSIIEGIVSDVTLVYKQNVGGSTEGPLASSYSTVFANTPTDPAEATISYLGGAIAEPTAYLLVKGGGPTSGPFQLAAIWYFYNLTALGWNGTETLDLTDFWPNQGAISHVTLYSAPNTSTIPDGGSGLALFGTAMFALAPIRRYIARRS